MRAPGWRSCNADAVPDRIFWAYRVPLILIVTANSQTTPLQLSEEVRRVRGALGEGINFTVAHESEIRATDLIRRLLRDEPDILHFAGHGAGKNERGLSVKDDSGAQAALSDADLCTIMDSIPVPPTLVVLNACYSDELTSALAKTVRVVVGASGAIPDLVAHRFAGQFYEAIGRSLSIRSAIALAKCELGINGFDRDVIRAHAENDADLDIAFQAWPELMASFKVDQAGTPVVEKGHFHCMLWMRGVDQNISSVTYQICHESFQESFWETLRSEATNFWTDDFKTYGDVTIRATAWARDRGIGVASTVSDALRRHYGHSPSPVIKKAIKELADK